MPHPSLNHNGWNHSLTRRLIVRINQWRQTSRLFGLKNHSILSSPSSDNSSFWRESGLFHQIRIMKNSITGRMVGRLVDLAYNPVTILLILCLYLILVPYSFLPSVSILGISLPVFNLIPYLIIMGYLMLRILDFRQSHRIGFPQVFLCWGLWMGLGLLSAGQTQPLTLSLMKWFLFEFSGSFVFILIYLTPFERRDYRVISIALTVMIVGMAGYGIWTGLNGEPGWFGLFWEQKLKHNPDFIRIYEHFVPSSAFGNSSMRGSLIVMLLPGLVFNTLLFFPKLKRGTRIIMIGLIILLSWALYRCDTSGAYLTLFLSLGVIWIGRFGSKTIQWYRHSKKLVLPAAILLLTAMIIAVSFTTDFDIRHRRLQWKIAFHILAGSPILGVGTGNYPIHADRYASWYQEILPGGHHYNVADNYLLTFLVERGLAGILAAGIIGYRLIRRGLLSRALLIHDYYLETVIILLWPVIMINALFWDIGNHLSFRILFFISGAIWIRLVQFTRSSPLPSDVP